MADTYTDAQLKRGLDKLHRAELWRWNNPEAWHYMVRIARDRAEHERTISGRGLVEAVRGKAFVDRMGNDTRTNNDIAAVVARWIALEYPETARYIERRKTVFDLIVA